MKVEIKVTVSSDDGKVSRSDKSVIALYEVEDVDGDTCGEEIVRLQGKITTSHL